MTANDAAIISELVRVKAQFQLRAIMLHMGLEPAGAPHALLVGDTGEGKLSSRPSVAVAAARGATVSNTEMVGLHSQRKLAPPHMAMEPVTHRNLSQHAETCVSNTDEIVPVHGSFNR